MSESSAPPTPGRPPRQGNRAIAVMVKEPVPGRAKTRLLPLVDEAAAAELARCFFLDTVDLLSELPDTDVYLAVHPPEAAAAFERLAPGVPQVAQRGPDLGHRLDHVLTTLLDRGHHQAFAVGADSPTLPRRHLLAALAQLDASDTNAVFGPTEDGGYYLIGVEEPPGALVTSVTMSTPTVLADTLAVADELGVRVALGRPWYDVDGPPELLRLAAELLDRRGDGDGHRGAGAAFPARTAAVLRRLAPQLRATVPGGSAPSGAERR